MGNVTVDVSHLDEYTLPCAPNELTPEAMAGCIPRLDDVNFAPAEMIQFLFVKSLVDTANRCSSFLNVWETNIRNLLLQNRHRDITILLSPILRNRRLERR